MFENYKVAVRISLIDGVSTPIALLAKHFAKADEAAKLLQTRLNSISNWFKGGVAIFGAGAAVAAPLLYAIDKAAELQKQMLGIQAATGGTVAEMNKMRGAIEGIASRTVFSNVDVAKIGKLISTGSTFTAAQVSSVLPAYTKFADVQMMMKGTGYQESIPELLRLAHTAQKYTPEQITAYANMLTKASFVVPGSLSEIGNALKYSQGIGKQVMGVDDESMILTSALLNQMGIKGSRGGTNLIAAMTRTIPGIFGSGLLRGKSNEALRAMGMVDDKGHSKVFTNGKFDVFKWLGMLSEYTTREMGSNPEAIARQHIMTNMQHAFGAQGGRVASLLANPQAIELLGLIGKRFASVGGVESIQEKFADESVSQQWMNAKTNFQSAMVELGMTLLPTATAALKKLNANLQLLIEWMNKNPEKVKAIAKDFAYLSAVLMGMGSLAIVTSGFKALALIIALPGAPLVKGIASLVGLLGGAGVAGLAGASLLAVGAIGTLIYSMYQLYNIKPGVKFAPGIQDRLNDPATRAALDSMDSDFKTVRTRFDGGSGGSVGNVFLDGKKVGEHISGMQAKEMARPRTGSRLFDATMAPPSPFLGG